MQAWNKRVGEEMTWKAKIVLSAMPQSCDECPFCIEVPAKDTEDLPNFPKRFCVLSQNFPKCTKEIFKKESTSDSYSMMGFMP